MKPDEAAWVYEHVICDYHLANEAHWWCGPDQTEDRDCPCQFGCVLCRAGRHQACRTISARTDGGFRPQPETALRVPAAHRPDRKRPLHVAVWLADRVCRVLCDCTVCHPPQLAPAPEPDAWAHGLLFELEAS